MSTETPRSEPKKAKKDKSERKSEKKRKREKELEENQPTEEPVSKKKKKSRPSEDASTAPAVEPTPTKKAKKSKHSAADPATPVPAPPAASKTKPTKTSSTFSDSNLTTHSPFTHLTSSFYIPLAPCANGFPLKGACAEHLSPLILTYYPPLHGVVLSYSNPRLSEEPGPQLKNNTRQILSKSVDEFGGTFLWLTAEFVVFRPVRGTYIEGYVSLQNESVLGLMCYNYFNAAVERLQLPKEWTWTGDDGMGGEEGGDNYYVDGEGRKVEGRVVFRVKDFKADSGAGTINVVGSLLSEEGDRGVGGEASSSRGTKEKRKKT